MQYYMIEWENEEPDEPWRVLQELTDRGNPRRRIEVYRVGMQNAAEAPEEELPPMDPRELAGEDGHLTSITRFQFEDMWEQSRYVPTGFMDLYY